jgi:hypothetical protein
LPARGGVGSLRPVLGPAVSAISLSLLGASGIAKVIDPGPTSGALKAARLPGSDSVSRALGVAELVAAALGLTLGGMALIPATLLYAAFALFTLAALRQRLPIQSCGCFGRDDTPPTKIHITYNAVAASALTWTAFSGDVPIIWNAPLMELALLLLFAVLGAFASYLLLARLPLTVHGGR